MGVKSSSPNTAPSRGSHNIEPSASSLPAHGHGLHHKFLDRFADDIRVGRVDDLYNSYLCANVSVHGRISNLPCLWLEAAAGRWMGAKTFSPPTIGSSVLVWMPQDAKFGVILGTINPPNRTELYVPTQIGYTPINIFDPTSIQDAEGWEMNGFMINAGMGVMQDLFPGDNLITNELHAALGMLKFLSVMRGGEGARIEAYAFDDLLRIISHNYQHRSAGAEHEIMVDYEEIDDIVERTVRLAEGLGQDPELPVADGDQPVSGDVGRWRHRRFFGPLANMLQDFVSRPPSGTAMLPKDVDKDKVQPDMGLRQKSMELGGYEVVRTVTGIRLHKCRAIAVPKRKRYPDDLDGNNLPVERKAVKPFKFSEGPGFIGHVAQIRDQTWWMYNKMFPQRFLEKDKDWDVPDENDCPAIAVDAPAVPLIGGFYREFPSTTQVEGKFESADIKFNADTGDNPRDVVQGDAFIDLGDDGSIVFKDNWGSEIRMSGGHIVFSASKDIMNFAGGSTISMAGDDAVFKANKSMDLSTSQGQFRIYSTDDIFVHSKQGGMLFSMDSRGYKYADKPGEQRHLGGVLFRIGSGDALGGFQVKASNATFTLDGGTTSGGMFYVGPIDLKGKNRPDLVNRCRGAFNWFGTADTTGFELWKCEPGDKKYIEFYGGGMFCSDRIHTDNSVEARRNGIFGGTVSQHADWSRVPLLSTLVNEKKCFDPNLWAQFPYPYRDDDLKKVDFTFRESVDYATSGSDAAWVETFWQRDLNDKLDTWTDAEHVDGSRPYPGKDKFPTSWWTYAEINLNEYGRPKKRDVISGEGGTWSPTSWDSIKVNPAR